MEERAASTHDDTSARSGGGAGGGVRSGGTYRLSIYEDGREVGRHEADISVPENMVSFDWAAEQNVCKRALFYNCLPSFVVC